jgi:hypothetical protein
MIMDILFIILGSVIIGFLAGKATADAYNQWAFKEILKDLGITEQQMRDLAEKNGLQLPKAAEPELPALEVRLERIGDVIYAYRKDDDQFLGQGPDRDTLVRRLTENLNNVRVIISKEDGADLIQNG